ncbi:phosphate ABC transporter membrane protein 2, PhoT family [Methanolobus vulcani]|uniref:Phosphate transport system permease protein PstA n=1 Tax=Methanolobus vulcani TaxID=38026 RepID=A0A7Z7FCR9_9EURY|nr:phosphate ABC transporter permease PstA [Methanolobus vulcani]SDF94387.1 phosphate ABC transporter membrane protein 2, PhoT family [Methanolobus vulcani]
MIRKINNLLFKSLAYLAASTTVIILLIILGIIAYEAVPSLHLDFLLSSEVEVKGFGGAIGNAIVGTIILSTLSPLVATPFAIGTAVYMKKYIKKGKLAQSFSFLIDVLSGTPSIVLGIFGLVVLVYILKPITGGFSLISGVIALAILILPVMERSTETAIDTVPHELEEASYALGANKWETIKYVTLPYSLNGILTGLVLSIGRAAEESAVVVLTAGYSQFYPELKMAANDKLLFGIKFYPFQDLVAALPITVYHGFEFPNMVDRSESFAAAFVLIAIVMLINATARLIVWRRRIG